ncbi:hypothetical protein QP178_00800 [Sphingomonas aurantiaca]|uniref:hypothetical protein n=1 Tax=Sphingomonas TaxID=13687 RepID=UPI0006F4B5AC|nr:hypothetical protein [Sphingomonas sp. Leaf28]KQN10821.1 hypothetical protein ASE79_12005 [Sphingomonas sp. Leaf28]
MNYYHNIEGEQISPMVLPTISVRGDDLLALRYTTAPGTHALANLRVDYRPTDTGERAIARDGHSGPGLYACFWDRELFYIGTFAGTGRPTNGNVARERWTKHVAGMTFRGHGVTIGERALHQIAEDAPSALGALLLEADRARLSKTAGMLQTQYATFRFASRHWDDFALLDPAMLARFAFVYLRPSLHGRLAGMDKATLDPHLRAMERGIVTLLDPPCNAASTNRDGTPGPGIADTEKTMRQVMDSHLAAVQSDHPDYQLRSRRS